MARWPLQQIPPLNFLEDDTKASCYNVKTYSMNFRITISPESAQNADTCYNTAEDICFITQLKYWVKLFYSYEFT